MAHQQGGCRPLEEFDVADRLGPFQPAQQLGQRPQQGLQFRHQHQAVVGSDDVLAGLGAKAHFQAALAFVPAHRDAGATAIAEFGSDHGRGPGQRLHPGQPAELLGQGFLLEGQLVGMGQVLQGATAAAVGHAAGRRTPQRTGLQHSSGLDHLTAGTEHPRLDPFARQGAGDEPGPSTFARDAAPVVGQPLDAQQLPFAGRYPGRPGATGRLEAQSATAPLSARHRRRSTGSDRLGHR